MPRRIEELSYGDITYEGEGSSVEGAVDRALEVRDERLLSVRASERAGTFDLFLEVLVREDGSRTFRAILRS